MLPTLVVIGERTASEVMEAACLANSAEFSHFEKLYFDGERFLAEDVPRISAQGRRVFFIAGISNVDIKSEVIDQCLCEEHC